VRKAIKIVITGNVGTGKSTLSKFLISEGYQVFESDEEVRKVYSLSEVKKKITLIFSKKVKELTLCNGSINSINLGKFVFENTKELEILENIIYPYLGDRKRKFIKKNIDSKIIFFDIPLLFEKKLHLDYDYIIYLRCNFNQVRKRVLQREGMTEQKLKNIMSNQIKDISRFKKYISIALDTGESFAKTKSQIRNFINKIVV
tara:strand:- start:268 stop:873 length:606 start_codon:yes stop_codon:yes gene_type:complete